MVRLMHIDTVKYEMGKPRGFFILGDMDAMRYSKVAVFGTGLEAYLTFSYLQKQGIKVSLFLNNDSKMKGKKFCGTHIEQPLAVINCGYYIVVAMSSLHYDNEGLWQLKVHHHDDYGLAFMEYAYCFEPALQMVVMDAVNEILCENCEKNIKDLISPVINVGASGNILKNIPELCWTTTWSNCLMEWFYKKYAGSQSVKSRNDSIKMLEIGPGMGVFSLVAHKLVPKMDIYWLMFHMEEESIQAVFGKYDKYPANLFKTYYGVIESPDFVIREKFDVIIMTEVMEHFVLNPVATMKKIKEMLNEGGYLLVSTPNWGHLPIYRSYRELPNWTGMEDYKDMYIGHSYQYTKDEIEDILNECNLEIEEYQLSDSNNHNIIIKHRH